MNISKKKFAVLNTIAVLALVFLTGCAALKNFRSTQEVILGEVPPPYYHGKVKQKIKNVGHLPVAMDIRLKESLMNEDVATAVEPFLEEINGNLESLEITIPIGSLNLPAKEAPDIYIGNLQGIDFPGPIYTEEDLKAKYIDPEGGNIVIYANGPSNKWKEKLIPIAKEKNIDHFLYITIGTSEYFPNQKNWKGSKEITLGTGYKLPLKWLTSLNDPITVIQFSGILLNANGKIIRSGAEGFLAMPNSFLESTFGATKLFSDDDIENGLKFKRREDLPGKPLAWKIALNNLVANLLNKNNLIIQ